MIQNLFIANRGEIAIRIARAAAAANMRSIAAYAEDDATSLHLRYADETAALPGRGPRAYLDIERIVACAVAAGADAIHPGYGFLSENAEFAAAVEAAGMVFVGPTPQTLRTFGDKVSARALAESCGVSIPAGAGPVDVKQAQQFLASLPPGRSMMIKAVSGGGGRGMRLVREQSEVAEAFERAGSEAQGAFGNMALYVEEFLSGARHIEVQIIGDGAAVSHLWERECSLQRRHQKIIEIAPSPSIDPALRNDILKAALALAKASSYRGLGTMEFLVAADGASFRFIEGNARLQVEHTVTEEVLGIDLVRAQLEVARGSTLADIGLEQSDIPPCRGFALQARVNLESFASDGSVRPGGGRLAIFQPPTGPGVRTDTYGYPGYETNPAFDSLIAKVICHSPSQAYADVVTRARRALIDMQIEGAPANLDFLVALLEDERVIANNVDTGFIDANAADLATKSVRAAAKRRVSAPAVAAAALDARGSAVASERQDGAQSVGSPMQGTIVQMSLALGDIVWPGRTVAILEAMKMEHEVRAEISGTVRELCKLAGDPVFVGEPLLFVEAGEGVVASGQAAGVAAHASGDAGAPWLSYLDELQRRRAMAEGMGGPVGIERQHSQGKLTVRERIDALADPGSFREFMALTGSATYENGELKSFIPKPAVNGTVTLDGRTVFVTGGDFTARGGSGAGQGAMGQELSITQRAIEWRLPYVRLLDAVGGSVRTFEEVGRTYLPDGNSFAQHDVTALSVVPTVSAVLGSVAGMPAIHACLAHFNVMVEGISQIFPGGPPVVKAALGIDISKEDLGGSHIHTQISGSVNNLAKTEAEAFEQVRRFLSYLPSSVYELPPRGPVREDSAQRQDALLEIMKPDRRQSYDSYALLRTIVDQDSFFELAGLYGRGRITGFARIEGYPVGIMANNPRQNGGLTDVAAGSKVMQLIQLCDLFHLPLISLADEPGFMVGIESEKLGIERAGARLVAMVCNSRMPWITVVVGKLYGVGGQCHQRPSGMFRRFAWPSASWGSMHISGGVSAAYRREIDAAEDPEAKRNEIETRLRLLSSPFRTAEATGQDIIDPRETRMHLIEFVRDAQRVLATQVGPPRSPYLP